MSKELFTFYLFIMRGYYCSGTITHNEEILLFWDHVLWEKHYLRAIGPVSLSFPGFFLTGGGSEA